jgi:hypothetical protein
MNLEHVLALEDSFVNMPAAPETCLTVGMTGQQPIYLLLLDTNVCSIQCIIMGRCSEEK